MIISTTDPSSIDLSIIIPVYRSESTLNELTNQLYKSLVEMQVNFEIIYVNDGSPDQSWGILQSLKNQFKDKVKIINLMRNFGQHSAILCGIRQSQGRFILTMDDDLQNPPSQIPLMYDVILKEGYDLVYGAYKKKNHAKWRNLGTLVVGFCFRRIFNLPVTPTSFRIFRRQLADALAIYNSSFIYLDGLLGWSTQNVGIVYVQHQDRFDKGSSSYSIRKLISLSLNLFVNFSTAPIRYVFIFGLFISLTSFIFVSVLLIRWIFEENFFPGYLTLISSICFFGGIQLISLGLVGEYVGKILTNVNEKPQYIVRECL